ncbi:MAG TPA: hypothetical protein VMV37_06025 [Gammaproteobacteria bacterium]|nr:hypothetical protein [Gammaproteobacteria bacterium]
MSPWFGLILVTAFAAVGVVLILTAGGWWRRGSAHGASKNGPA